MKDRQTSGILYQNLLKAVNEKRFQDQKEELLKIITEKKYEEISDHEKLFTTLLKDLEEINKRIVINHANKVTDDIFRDLRDIFFQVLLEYAKNKKDYLKYYRVQAALYLQGSLLQKVMLQIGEYAKGNISNEGLKRAESVANEYIDKVKNEKVRDDQELFEIIFKDIIQKKGTGILETSTQLRKALAQALIEYADQQKDIIQYLCAALAKQGDDNARVKEYIDYLRKVPEDMQGGLRLKGCRLIRMSPPLDKKNLNDLSVEYLSIGSSAAYVRSGDDQLFYANYNKWIQLDIGRDKLQQFDKEMNPTYQARVISKDELEKIKSITGHTHSEKEEKREINEKNTQILQYIVNQCLMEIKKIQKYIVCNGEIRQRDQEKNRTHIDDINGKEIELAERFKNIPLGNNSKLDDCLLEALLQYALYREKNLKEALKLCLMQYLVNAGVLQEGGKSRVKHIYDFICCFNEGDDSFTDRLIEMIDGVDAGKMLGTSKDLRLQFKELMYNFYCSYPTDDQRQTWQVVIGKRMKEMSIHINPNIQSSVSDLTLFTIQNGLWEEAKKEINNVVNNNGTNEKKNDPVAEERKKGMEEQWRKKWNNDSEPEAISVDKSSLWNQLIEHISSIGTAQERDAWVRYLNQGKMKFEENDTVFYKVEKVILEFVGSRYPDFNAAACQRITMLDTDQLNRNKNKSQLSQEKNHNESNNNDQDNQPNKNQQLIQNLSSPSPLTRVIIQFLMDHIRQFQKETIQDYLLLTVLYYLMEEKRDAQGVRQALAVYEWIRSNGETLANSDQGKWDDFFNAIMGGTDQKMFGSSSTLRELIVGSLYDFFILPTHLDKKSWRERFSEAKKRDSTFYAIGKSIFDAVDSNKEDITFLQKERAAIFNEVQEEIYQLISRKNQPKQGMFFRSTSVPSEELEIKKNQFGQS